MVDDDTKLCMRVIKQVISRLEKKEWKLHGRYGDILYKAGKSYRPVGFSEIREIVKHEKY